MYYTGIGSRHTPLHVMNIMTNIGIILAHKKYILRSGHADSADISFELGVHKYNLKYNTNYNNSEIYIPNTYFNKDLNMQYINYIIPNFALAINILKNLISTQHYNNLSIPAKKLHLRNVYQVLGSDLNIKSKFVIYYAKPKSKNSNYCLGGTNTAVSLAIKHKIPTFNLYHKELQNNILDIVKQNF